MIESVETPLEALVDSIIGRAVASGASDIHFEPLRERFRIRYRVDGILVEAGDVSPRLTAAITSRLKLLAGMSLADRRAPQDGRMQFPSAGRGVDLRASSVPALHGESIVLRILDHDSLRPGLADLGFLPADLECWKRIIGGASGLVLVTGPTGSGKTTTLYSSVLCLRRAELKIISIEDPVEYSIPGINQSQVRPEIGMTFASALRAILRQSPNVIMLGEIRDQETAGVALNAALTGHLIFSTLHTTDAVGAIARLLDMGVPPFVVASGIRAILAQRLVRRADGRGRIAVFELVEVDDELRGLIHARAPESKLREFARARRPGLWEDGLAKVKAGLTTPEEIASMAPHEL